MAALARVALLGEVPLQLACLRQGRQPAAPRKGSVSPAALHPYAPGDARWDSLCCNMFFPLDGYFFMVSCDPPCPCTGPAGKGRVAHGRASAAQPGDLGRKTSGTAKQSNSSICPERNHRVHQASRGARVTAEVKAAEKIVLVWFLVTTGNTRHKIPVENKSAWALTKRSFRPNMIRYCN